jgi:tripartite-type tricarboxylate transporter receptor subunit TctC
MVEQLRQIGANLVHVPYKGGSQLITDAAGAQFDLLLANPYAPINALIAEGKLRVLAVTGPPHASADIPLGELGFTAANLTSTFGFYAPASTPADIQQRFHAEVNRLLQSAEMQERLRKLDNMAYPMSQQAFATLVRQTMWPMPR